jgi:hypothetical protein
MICGILLDIRVSTANYFEQENLFYNKVDTSFITNAELETQ